jgi:hypothetical protein
VAFQSKRSSAAFFSGDAGDKRQRKQEDQGLTIGLRRDLNVHLGSQTMSLGLILIIILVIFLLGGFSGRFGGYGYGYGYGHGGVGAIGVILIILVVLLLLGRI